MSLIGKLGQTGRIQHPGDRERRSAARLQIAQIVQLLLHCRGAEFQQRQLTGGLGNLLLRLIGTGRVIRDMALAIGVEIAFCARHLLPHFVKAAGDLGYSELGFIAFFVPERVDINLHHSIGDLSRPSRVTIVVANADDLRFALLTDFETTAQMGKRGILFIGGRVARRTGVVLVAQRAERLQAAPQIEVRDQRCDMGIDGGILEAGGKRHKTGGSIWVGHIRPAQVENEQRVRQICRRKNN